MIWLYVSWSQGLTDVFLFSCKIQSHQQKSLHLKPHICLTAGSITILSLQVLKSLSICTLKHSYFQLLHHSPTWREMRSVKCY